MSAIYRIVSPRRLTAPALVARSLEARVVYHHLLCGEVACQVPGLVRVGVLGLAEETNLDPPVVRRALDELVLYQLLEVDEAARLIRLPGVPSDHARAFAGANNVKGVIEALRSFPASPVRDRHAAELQAVCAEELRPLWTGLVPGSKGAAAPPQPPPTPPPEPPSNPLPDPVPNPLPNPVRTKEKEQEQEQDQEEFVGDAGASASGRARFDPAELAQRIRVAREGGASALTVEVAAKRSGIPAPTLRAFEAGHEVPLRSELEALARIYGDRELAEVQLPDRDPAIVAFVVGALHQHRIDLKLAAPDDPAPDVTADVARLVFAPEESPEQPLSWRAGGPSNFRS